MKMRHTPHTEREKQRVETEKRAAQQKKKKKIAEKNEAFWAATKSEQRVAIARDVTADVRASSRERGCVTTRGSTRNWSKRSSGVGMKPKRETVGWTVGINGYRVCAPATGLGWAWSRDRRLAWVFGARVDAEAWIAARVAVLGLHSHYKIRRVTRAIGGNT